MEYLSDGDLHKYLGSPLLEKEGQHIVFQVLEGSHFMHDNGFAHRDLKPVVSLAICVLIQNISSYSEYYRTYWLCTKAQIGGSRSQTLESASVQQRDLQH